MVFTSESINHLKQVRERIREVTGLSYSYHEDHDLHKEKIRTSSSQNKDPGYHLPKQYNFVEEDDGSNIITNKHHLFSFVQENVKCNICSSSVSIEIETVGIVTSPFRRCNNKIKNIHTC